MTPNEVCCVLLPLLLCVGAMRAASAQERVNPAAGLLRGLILDAETGRPAACAVAITDASGRIVTESESFKTGFRCDGRFLKELPPGPTRVRVSRGFETRAEERAVEAQAGGETEMVFRLQRIADLRKRGWFAGDSHVHHIHGERTVPVDFDFVALSARAEDLQYLSLSHEWRMDDPTPEKLEEALGPLSKPDCVLTWNIEAPKNYFRGDAGRCLGHCWTLGMKGRTTDGQDVIPLLLYASAHDYESKKLPFANFESHLLIRAQGGSVFYSHPARWWTGPWGGQGGYPKQEKMRVSNMAVELPLDTLIGPTFDGLDVMTGAGEHKANAMAFELWCLLLNHGYRVAATASSDACFDRPGGGRPGTVRVYTHLDDGKFSLSAVSQATARGRTFVTSGPLLLAAVEGKPPGSALFADGKVHDMAVEAWASAGDSNGLTRLELLRNGTPVVTNVFSPALPAVKTELPIRESESAWYCVRVFGGDPQRQRAISGAFFFDAKPHQPPAPVPARVRVSVSDADTGERLSAGTLTEVAFQATLPQDMAKHGLTGGEGLVTVAGTSRLRAEAPGYQAQTLSPFLDNPALVDFVTGLTAEDLLKWETFERTRSLLGEVSLAFRLKRVQRSCD